VAIMSAAAVIAVGLLTIPIDTTHSSMAVVGVVIVATIGLAVVSGFRYLTARKEAQLQISGDERYRRLAEEYRRLSDLAITAQEHTDLKIGQVTAQLDYLREQNDSLQKILRDVE
jgi:hypothetical protein